MCGLISANWGGPEEGLVGNAVGWIRWIREIRWIQEICWFWGLQWTSSRRSGDPVDLGDPFWMNSIAEFVAIVMGNIWLFVKVVRVFLVPSQELNIATSIGIIFLIDMAMGYGPDPFTLANISNHRFSCFRYF